MFIVTVTSGTPPDLSRIAVGVELSLDSPVWTLDTSPGQHMMELAVRTPFGVGRYHPFRYVVPR